MLNAPSYKIKFYELFVFGHWFIQCGLYQSAFSTYAFRKQFFLFLCLYFLFVLCFKFNVSSKVFITVLLLISDKFTIVIIIIIISIIILGICDFALTLQSNKIKLFLYIIITKLNQQGNLRSIILHHYIAVSWNFDISNV